MSLITPVQIMVKSIGVLNSREFAKTCKEHGIGQKFTRVNRPQTNGKAERVIRTLMEM